MATVNFDKSEPDFVWCDLQSGGAERRAGAGRPVMGQPYLPLPQQTSQPAQLRRDGQAGFQVHHVHHDGTSGLNGTSCCQPVARPGQDICEERIYRSYGEWFQAHQRPPPKEIPPKPHPAVASSYWPYGRGVNILDRSLEQNSNEHEYLLDNRPLTFVVPHRPHQISPTHLSRRAGRTQIRTEGDDLDSVSSTSSCRSSPTLRLAGATLHASDGLDLSGRSYQQPLLGSHSEANLAATKAAQVLHHETKHLREACQRKADEEMRAQEACQYEERRQQKIAQEKADHGKSRLQKLAEAQYAAYNAASLADPSGVRGGGYQPRCESRQ